ncbi:ABC transporter substrate-binding protein [Desulfosediminicola sp.]|uniref:ABC transporter substrate-binding protein n=1 Tax=Desulfosediminicola sp. TaxID=2886825 RepID=UPI003AF2E047
MVSVHERKVLSELRKVANKSLVCSLWVLVLLLPHEGSAQLSASSPAIKKLFIVHSYEAGHLCGQPQHDGAIAGLARSGWIVDENLAVRTYYMDTKRTNNSPALIQQQAILAIQEIEQYQPDVVLTLDDNAFKTIALSSGMKNQTFVFSGMNAQPEEYNSQYTFMSSRENPGGRITGVYEKLHFFEAVRVMSIMHEYNKILVLEDLSPTGKAISRQVDLELSLPGQQSVSNVVDKVARTKVHSWEEFQEIIAQANDDPEIGAIYLGTLLLHDSSGETYTAEEIISYYISHSTKPAIGLNYAFIKQGLYGGATVDFFAMGQLAGEKVARILSGAEAGTLPIEDAPRVALVFNLQRAESLGLEIPSDILLAADEVFRK